MRQFGLFAIAATASVADIYGLAQPGGPSLTTGSYHPGSVLGGPAQLFVSATCNIKGDIVGDNGDHVYVVPGQADYGQTRIDPGHGERWFCSEPEAQTAGWHRATT